MRDVVEARSTRGILGALACAALVAVALVAPAPAGAAASTPRAYTNALFTRVPIPPQAHRVASPPAPIGQLGATFSLDVVHLVRYYLVASTFGVAHFAQSHFAHDEWGQSGTVDGAYSSYEFSAMSLCANPHAAFCGVTYSFEQLSGSRQELRVDVIVVWKAVHVVELPAGTVTLTGYRTISLTNPSSGPVTVTPTPAQVARLRSDIAALRSAPGGMCMEDSLLYKLSVTSATGRVIWSATADECPGVLLVTTSHGRVALNDRSCALDSLVASMLPSPGAAGSIEGLKACQSAF